MSAIGMPLRADARANRQRLIDAAHDVFRERGLDAEMKTIAERAGVGVGTIYRNFPTKDDLITAIAAELVDTMVAVCNEATSVADPVDAMRVFVRGGLTTINQYGDVVMATKQRGLPPACHALFTEFNIRGRIIELIQRGVDEGCFRSEMDVAVAATLVETSLFPPSYQFLRQTHTHEQIVDAVTDLVLHGIQVR